jgi:hypothetical protein
VIRDERLVRATESTEGSTPLTGIELVRCAPDRAIVIKNIIKIGMARHRRNLPQHLLRITSPFYSPNILPLTQAVQSKGSLSNMLPHVG